MITIIIIIIVNRHALLPSATMVFSLSRNSRRLRDLHLSLSQPFTAAMQTHRALHGSLVAIISPPSYDRPNASSFVVVIIISHFFFQKYIYADYLGFRRKTERRCLVQSTGLIFFFFARIYSIITLSKQYFVYSLGNSEDPHMIHLNYLFFFSAFLKFFPSLFQPRETLRRYRTLFTLI